MTQGIKTPQRQIDLRQEPLKRLKECCDEKRKAGSVRGSGNVFRDLGMRTPMPNNQGILAAEIIKALDRERLTVRAAHSRTGNSGGRFLAHPQCGPRAVPLIASSRSSTGSGRVSR